MPNWCNNSITVRADAEDIKRFSDFMNKENGKNWFDFFLPCPQELIDSVADMEVDDNKKILIEKYGYADWYSWSIDNWGCKWNCDANDWHADGEVIDFWFDSPWGPPIALYEEMQSQGFDVEAYYHEEGMAYVGAFKNGNDESYEYSDLESLDNIPEDIVEYWGLREQIEERAEWEDDESETDWVDEPEDFTSDTAKDWIKGLLNEGIVEITFIKSDGTERVMKCTLKDEIISNHWIPKNGESQRKYSEDVLPVFDVEAKGWRSFRFDSIREVKFSLE